MILIVIYMFFAPHRGDSLALFPTELNVLKGRKAAFIVEVTNYNVSNPSSLYSINKIKDISIISELETKFETLVYTLPQISVNFFIKF